MPIVLNAVAEQHSRSVVSSGMLTAAPFALTEERRQAMLADTAAPQFFLGEDTDTGALSFPVFLEGKLSISALTIIANRTTGATAAPQDIRQAASRLLALATAGPSSGGTRRAVSARAVRAGIPVRVEMKDRKEKGEQIYELTIYGTIGRSWWGDDDNFVSSKAIKKQLDKLPEGAHLEVHINSEGGDVFEGKAIYSLLAQRQGKTTCYVDGLAASAASFIAMAANEIVMPEGSFMMIHRAWSMSQGHAEDMMATAGLLQKVDDTLVDLYSQRTGLEKDRVRQMLKDETWMTGKEAFDLGFCDRLLTVKVAATVLPDQLPYNKVPAALRPNRVLAARLIGQ